MEATFCTFVHTFGSQTAIHLIQCHLRILDLKREYEALTAGTGGYQYDTQTLVRLRDICGEIVDIQTYMKRFIQNYR